MANYSNSVLLDGIGKLDAMFNSKELRKPSFNAFNAFFEKREILIPSAKELREAEQRTVTAKYLTKVAPTIGSTRSCTPSGNIGESGAFDLTWQTYSFVIKSSEKIGENNYYKTPEQVANDLYNGFLAAYTQFEADAITTLEANRSGLNNGTLGTFDAVNDIMELTGSANYYNYILTEMHENSYFGQLQDICSYPLEALIRLEQAQGPNNGTNLQYQLYGFNHYPAAITSASSHFGTSYICEQGSLAVLDWIPALNRRGKDIGAQKWTTMPDPFGYPLTWSVFVYQTCADTSSGDRGDASGGATQDSVDFMEISVDLSWNVAPITTALETPIFKYGLIV